MSLAEKIVTKMIAQGLVWPGGPQNAVIHRTYAGRNQRKCGAWSWFLRPAVNDDQLYPDVGAIETASEVARGFDICHDQWNSFTLFARKKVAAK